MEIIRITLYKVLASINYMMQLEVVFGLKFFKPV